MATSAREAGKVLLDAEAIDRTLSRIAHEIIEQNDDLDTVALVGIHRRGVPLAQRLRRLIEEDLLALGMRHAHARRHSRARAGSVIRTPFRPHRTGLKGFVVGRETSVFCGRHANVRRGRSLHPR